jgi:hypothetical protein
MSTNIHFLATREIQVVKTGQRETQEERFGGVWQTPTDVTYKITAQADPIQAYRDWILSVNADYEVDIYAEDDIFREREPVGTETRNEGVYHLKEFDAWITSRTEQGYEIAAEAW